MYSFSAISSFLLCIFVVLHASILVFGGSDTNNPLKAAGKMCRAQWEKRTTAAVSRSRPP